MNVELVTKNDLDDLKQTLIKEIRTIAGVKPEMKKWLKSADVRELLGCSPGPLQSKVYGDVPPVTIRSIIPSLLPAQVTAVAEGASVRSVTVITDVELLQRPF